jgi:hypothetical protein
LTRDARDWQPLTLHTIYSNQFVSAAASRQRLPASALNLRFPSADPISLGARMPFTRSGCAVKTGGERVYTEAAIV